MGNFLESTGVHEQGAGDRDQELHWVSHLGAAGTQGLAGQGQALSPLQVGG